MLPNPATTATTEAALADLRQTVDQTLESLLPAVSQPPEELHRAMRYSVLNGGKRIRPLFVFASAQALNIPVPAVAHLAAAVELIHAYSLVHDDLPAMDDDDLRRGRPTVHRRFDEATAILAGDALQALAFAALVHAPDGGSSATVPRVVSALAEACGSLGMAGGQAVDLGAVGRDLSLEQLSTMHRLKTGALIRCSVSLPAVFVDANSETVAALRRYGDRVGLAFQIHDDVLDVAGETEVTGKPQGSDQQANKPTFPALMGLEQSTRAARELVDEALAAIDRLQGDTALLNHLAEYSISRSA